MLPVRTFVGRVAAAVPLALCSAGTGYCQMAPGGPYGGGVGAHQGHILTGPGATGIPANYFRGAAPGMSLLPQQAPSGAFNHGPYYTFSPTPSPSILGWRRHGTSVGIAMGRGVGPAPPGGDKNPARIMLDGINGRRRGKRAAPPPNREPSGTRPSTILRRGEAPVVYFARRGAYEDMVYRTNRGSYRQRGRPATTTPANNPIRPPRPINRRVESSNL